VSIYVNKNKGFQQAKPTTRECPHCGAHTQLLPVAAPSYALLAQTRPKHAGLLFRCAACNEPRFLRAVVRSIDAERVELAPNLVEVERARERFQFAYLPDIIEQLVRETLECYSIGALNAFATMCRRATHTALRTLDAGAKNRWHDTLIDVLRVCEVDSVTAHTVETVLFGDDPDPPEITPDEGAVLVEALKDLFYQSYVRTAKLRAAMRVRRFFASENVNVTPLERDGLRELA
jgi:hypothetical protein